MEELLQPHAKLLEPVRLANDMKSFRNSVGSNIAVATGEQYRNIWKLDFHNFGELDAFDPIWHYNVREDEGDLLPLAEKDERCARPVHHPDLGLPLPKQFASQFSEIRLVFDHQHDDAG